MKVNGDYVHRITVDGKHVTFGLLDKPASADVFADDDAGLKIRILRGETMTLEVVSNGAVCHCPGEHRHGAEGALLQVRAIMENDGVHLQHLCGGKHRRTLYRFRERNSQLSIWSGWRNKDVAIERREKTKIESSAAKRVRSEG